MYNPSRLQPLHVASVLLLASALHAQWLNYPTPGVPQNKDGSPNLSAPAPRTAAGKPDLSGIWLAERNRPCPKDGCADMEIGQEFMEIGWSVPGGLPYQNWAASLKKERMAKDGVGDPGSSCRPTGIIKMHTSPFFRRIVQTPDLLLILTERDAEFRQIFTDGRPLPKDPNPTWQGYSIGHWDGEDFVAETAGFKNQGWLDNDGRPATNALHVIERFRRNDFGNMDILITIDDSQAYTKPWTVKLPLKLLPDTDLLEYVCGENNKDLQHLVGK